MLEGVEGLLHDATRPSGRAKIADSKVREVIELTNFPPDGEATHWTVRATAAHANWTFHFIPTSSSWLNAVEGFFAKLTRRRLKGAMFNSVAECEAAIARFIADSPCRLSAVVFNEQADRRVVYKSVCRKQNESER